MKVNRATATAILVCMTILHAGDVYEWGRVKIGGGGYQTGVVSHAPTPGLLYMKGDVMGLHRRKPGEDTWYQTTWSLTPEEGLILGTGGIGVHPDDGAIIYTCFGADGGESQMGLYKSTDYGDTWTHLLEFYENTNRGSARKWSDNIEVDPNNGDIVYVGTRKDGVFRTVDGGASFDFKPHPAIPAAPDTGSAVGSRSIAIDPSETVDSPLRSRNIYISAYSIGIYHSSDGGNSFALMEGSPTHPRWIKRGANGTLYVIENNDVGLWKYDGSWTLIRKGRLKALAVDPHDAEGRRIFVSRGGNPSVHYRSSDGGASWDSLELDNGWVSVFPDTWDLRACGQATSSLDFDQSMPGRLYQCDAFGVWYTDDPWAATVKFYPMHEGCEGTVSFGISSPPEHPDVYPLYSGGSDANNYAHANPTDVYPREKLAPIEPPQQGTQWLAYGSDYDFCMNQPQIMYRVVQSHKQHQYVCKTTNGGRSAQDWTVVASSWKNTQLPNPVSWNGRSRKLAVSATDPDACFMAGFGGYGNYYTLDGGASWTKLTGVLPGNKGFIADQGWRMYGRDKPICADRVNGNYIYGYYKKDFYRSDGKGANGTWEKTFTFPAERNPDYWKTNAMSLAAAPDHAGCLVLNFGTNGLWMTTDHGDRWTRVEEVEDCRSCGWGKKAPGSDYSTIYIHAKIGGKWGIHRSTDLAQSWTRITPDHIMLNQAANITGDLRTYGTVYMSEGGRGIVYGKISDDAVGNQRPALPAHRTGRAGTPADYAVFDIQGRKLPAQRAPQSHSGAGRVLIIRTGSDTRSRLITHLPPR
jgi:photosystem II stability/assembly factor-like uncharacterized protein